MSDSQPETGAQTAGQATDRGLVLVGFMGAGKTSVGRALGRHLNWPFEDLDDRIEAREKLTVPRLFEVYGEPGFRERETAALREICSELLRSPRVIALGGGAFVQPENAMLIENLKLPTVFLDAPVDELLRRCRQEERIRPLCRDEEQFRESYDVRLTAYQGAVHKVDTYRKDIDEIAREVACMLGLG
jgi:shikimate kinase